MFVHLGQDTVVDENDIIGIFDLDNASISSKTRSFLAKAEKNGEVINVSFELPKSFIVCAKQGTYDNNVYISQISSATLLKRSEYLENIIY